jgi:hypothetical protein
MGAILDESTTGSIGIIEVEDGFLVRAERSNQTIVEVAVNHLDRQALERHAGELRRTRRPPWRRHHPGIWSNFPVTHQDFFRALGYELDSVSARNVVIDEVTDGLLIWYESDAEDGSSVVMHRIALGAAEIEEILNEAVRRRRVQPDAPPSHVYQRAQEPHSEDDGSDGHVTGWTIPRRGVPYQDLLRGIGRALDGAGARQVCVLEVPTGFAVRYRGAEGRQIWIGFTDGEVPVGGPESRHKPSRLLRRGLMGPSEPEGYSDLFRALGHELENTDASDIVITEQDDGLAVMYDYREPHQPLATHRVMRFLDPREQQALTEHARSRRGGRTRSRFRLARQ